MRSVIKNILTGEEYELLHRRTDSEEDIRLYSNRVSETVINNESNISGDDDSLLLSDLGDDDSGEFQLEFGQEDDNLSSLFDELVPNQSNKSDKSEDEEDFITDMESEEEESSKNEIMTDIWHNLQSDGGLPEELKLEQVESKLKDSNEDVNEDEDESYQEEITATTSKLIESVQAIVNIKNYEISPTGLTVSLRHKNETKNIIDGDRVVEYDYQKRVRKSLSKVNLRCIQTGEIVTVSLRDNMTIKNQEALVLSNGDYMQFEESPNSKLKKKDYLMYNKKGEILLKDVEIKALKSKLPTELEIFYKLNPKGETLVDTKKFTKLDKEPYKNIYDTHTKGFDGDEKERMEFFADFLQRELALRQYKTTIQLPVTTLSVSVNLKEKKYFGNEYLAQELSVHVNEVLNLTKDTVGNENTGGMLISLKGQTVQMHQYTIKNSSRTFKEYTTLQGALILREYTNTKQNLLIQVYPSENIRLTPYSQAHYNCAFGLSSDGKKIQNFNQSILKLAHLPKISHFRQFLNLNYLDWMEADIIDTPNKLYDMADTIKHLPPEHLFGYDAETTGLEFFMQLSEKRCDRLVTHSLSWRDNQAVIIPVRMRYCQNIPIELINEIVKPILETRRILAHNGQADVRFNIPDGIDLNLREDTMILIKHLIPFINKASGIGFKRALDDLIKAWRGYDMIDLQKYVFGPAGVKFDFSILNEDYLTAYGCPDTMLMRLMFPVLRAKLGALQEDAYLEHVQFARNNAKYCTWPGIGVDISEIERDKANELEVLAEIESKIYELTNKTPETFNIKSAPQKRNILYGYFNVPSDQMIRTKEGDLPTDKNALKKIKAVKSPINTGLFTEDIVDSHGTQICNKDDLNRMKYPIAELLLKHSDLSKNITSYYNGMLNNTLEGVYNPQYKDGHTDTWRSTDRLQITKKGIKMYMGAYSDEYAFADADFAAEEVRLAFNLAGDLKLINVLKNWKNDPHTATASSIFEVPAQYVTKEQRNAGKTSNFGIIYGMSGKTLAKRIANKDFISEEEEAWGIMCYNKFATNNKKVMDMIQINRAFVRENGFFINQLGCKMIYHQVVDVDDFRQRVFEEDPEIYKNYLSPQGYGLIPKFDEQKYRENVGSLATISGNYPIQSWAGAILMKCYNKMCQLIKEWGLEGKVFLPLHVHDEIGAVYHKSVHPIVIMKLFKEAMETEFDFPYPTAKLFIGVGYGKSWGEAKDDKHEIVPGCQDELVEEYDSGKYDSLEIVGSNHADYMQRRLEDYMIRESYKCFEHMVNDRKFVISEMIETIANHLWLPKKMGETFGKKTKRFDGIKFMEDKLCSDGKYRTDIPKASSYIKLICSLYGFNEDEFVIEDGNFDGVESVDTSSLDDFMANSYPHPNILITSSSVELLTVNIPIKNRPVALKYLAQFDVGEDKGKPLYVKSSIKKEKSTIYLMGLPPTIKEDLDQAIFKGILVQHIELPKIGELPFSIDVENYSMNIDGDLLWSKFGEKKYNEFFQILGEYRGESYKIKYKTSQVDSQLEWGLSYIGDTLYDRLVNVLLDRK